MVAEDDETSKDKEIDKLMALISLSFKKIYKPTNNDLRTLSNTSRANQDNSLRIHRNVGYENQRNGNVAGARENVGSSVMQKSRIQCYNCKEFGHVARECQKPKRVKDAAYHREKMLLCKQEEARIQLNAERADWRDDTDDDELEDQELEVHYIEEIDQNDDDNDLAKEHKLSAHQETISILSKQKEARIKLYKTREDKELDKVIELENKVKVLDNIVYKTSQSVQTMNMLNNKCQTSFAKLEFLKKAQRANPRLYDIGFYNDNLALMLAPDSDEVIRLVKESRSKLSDLIRPFDYDKLNNLCLNEEMVADLRYFNSLKLEVDSLRSQLETQKTQFLNEIDRLSKEYYYADHMNAILGVYTELDEDLKAQLQDKGIVISELKKLIEKLKGKSVDTKFEKSSIIRQPNAFKSQRPSVLGKPTTFSNSFLVEIVLFIVDSRCSKHMTGNLKLLINFVEKFLGMVKFGNDQIAPILGYGDLVQGAVTIKRVCYVEGLNHNLFSVGQFCDADLEVAFRKSMCFIRDLK
nr:integrase, catalytic region, zinc finger, CCHC-type, peptidase aspartic, catalytic [Tanacetum cinerariifolium]